MASLIKALSCGILPHNSVRAEEFDIHTGEHLPRQKKTDSRNSLSSYGHNGTSNVAADDASSRHSHNKLISPLLKLNPRRFSSSHDLTVVTVNRRHSSASVSHKKKVVSRNDFHEQKRHSIGVMGSPRRSVSPTMLDPERFQPIKEETSRNYVLASENRELSRELTKQTTGTSFKSERSFTDSFVAPRDANKTDTQHYYLDIMVDNEINLPGFSHG